MKREKDNQKSVYLPTTIGRVRRGWDSTLSAIRDGVSVIPSHLVSSAFYLVLSHLMIWLALTQPPGVMFGARVLTYVPWGVWVAIFALCGGILAQKRDYRLYIVLHIPAGLYSLVVMYGLMTGQIAVVGWLATAYLIYGTIQGMQNTRNEHELKSVSVENARNKQKLEVAFTEMQSLRAKLSDMEATNE